MLQFGIDCRHRGQVSSGQEHNIISKCQVRKLSDCTVRIKLEIGIVLEALYIPGKIFNIENKKVRGKRIPLPKTTLPFEMPINRTINCHTEEGCRYTFHNPRTKLSWEPNRFEHPIQKLPRDRIISLMQINFQKAFGGNPLAGVFTQKLLNMEDIVHHFPVLKKS